MWVITGPLGAFGPFLHFQKCSTDISYGHRLHERCKSEDRALSRPRDSESRRTRHSLSIALLSYPKDIAKGGGGLGGLKPP
ncbi:hypothetical protein EVAR_24652_1 [Eumeta japonica]|uniref:Uncharacterized protein n=1 Tax=Eumeta variegata TaxID=151549 RepID=A0A4C1V128_EUMVA|nr:hypothetical protein EVAR_24652_1 [Eumeta japonica]